MSLLFTKMKFRVFPKLSRRICLNCPDGSGDSSFQHCRGLHERILFQIAWYRSSSVVLLWDLPVPRRANLRTTLKVQIIFRFVIGLFEPYGSRSLKPDRLYLLGLLFLYGYCPPSFLLVLWRTSHFLMNLSFIYWPFCLFYLLLVLCLFVCVTTQFTAWRDKMFCFILFYCCNCVWKKSQPLSSPLLGRAPSGRFFNFYFVVILVR